MGTFAYLLNRDYHRQYDTNLQYYVDESARRLEADIQAHGDAVDLLAEQIETDLLSRSSNEPYWDVPRRSDFVEQRKRLDLHSSVFAPQNAILTPELLEEIAATHDAWESVEGAFDSRMMSVSYISTQGFIRTQPSHRVAFFPEGYDPRQSKLYEQRDSSDYGQTLFVDLDPLNSIYILSVVQSVTPGGNLSGVVAGVFELSFNLFWDSGNG
ncbi:MAG: hypothetical protein AAFN68_07445, partial [Pseudomonadota bacterium]